MWGYVSQNSQEFFLWPSMASWGIGVRLGSVLCSSAVSTVFCLFCFYLLKLRTLGCALTLFGNYWRTFSFAVSKIVNISILRNKIQRLIPYMWNLKRNDTNKLTKQKETHRLRKLSYDCQEEVIENWGFSCTHCYI